MMIKKAQEYALDWWNIYSSLGERQALCQHLGWHEGHAEGEASLEWLHPDEIVELKKIPYELLVEIEKKEN